jgi:hypothetical protein
MFADVTQTLKLISLNDELRMYYSLENPPPGLQRVFYF